MVGAAGTCTIREGAGVPGVAEAALDRRARRTHGHGSGAIGAPRGSLRWELKRISAGASRDSGEEVVGK